MSAYNVYIAGGWFSEEQKQSIEAIKTACQVVDVSYYYPKDHGIVQHGKSMHNIYDENIYQIEKCRLVIASTEGKDMGTLFECGYATANAIPVVYYFPHEVRFNLMLAVPAYAVFHSLSDLTKYLERYRKSGVPDSIPYEGPVE